MLNLPILARVQGARLNVAGNTLNYGLGGANMQISWPETQTGQLQDSDMPDVRRLVVALPADGSPLSFEVSARGGTAP
jgi:hypothetical protein